MGKFTEHPPTPLVMFIRSIGIAGFILGILFKVQHWPAANVMLLVSTLVTIVMLTILLLRKPGPWTLHVQRPAMLFGSLALALVGMLFKMMHWPGASIMLVIGLITCAAWFLTSTHRTAAVTQRS